MTHQLADITFPEADDLLVSTTSLLPPTNGESPLKGFVIANDAAYRSSLSFSLTMDLAALSERDDQTGAHLPAAPDECAAASEAAAPDGAFALPISSPPKPSPPPASPPPPSSPLPPSPFPPQPSRSSPLPTPPTPADDHLESSHRELRPASCPPSPRAAVVADAVADAVATPAAGETVVVVAGEAVGELVGEIVGETVGTRARRHSNAAASSQAAEEELLQDSFSPHRRSSTPWSIKLGHAVVMSSSFPAFKRLQDEDCWSQVVQVSQERGIVPNRARTRAMCRWSLWVP